MVGLELSSEFLAFKGDGVLGGISCERYSIDSLVNIELIIVHVISIFVLDVGDGNVVHHLDERVEPYISGLPEDIQVN